MQVLDGGVWKNATPHVKDAGVWKPVQEVWARDAGVWKRAWQNALVVVTVSPGSQYYTGSGWWNDYRGFDVENEDYIVISGGSISPSGLGSSTFSKLRVNASSYEGPVVYAFSASISNANSSTDWMAVRSLILNGIELPGRFVRNYDAKYNTILNSAEFQPFATSNDYGTYTFIVPTTEEQAILDNFNLNAVAPVFSVTPSLPFTVAFKG